MSENGRARLWIARAVRWIVLPGLAVVGLFLAYRWAEQPYGGPTPLRGASGNTVTIRLENAPFTSYAEERKTWSLWAARIDLERMPGASLSNIQSATLTDIRKGALYQLPGVSSPASPRDAVAATFHARQGRYALGDIDPVAPDISVAFSIKWQFKMQGDVVLRTRDGDVLRAPTLTILEMTNRRSQKLERRVLCEAGAEVVLKGVRIRCNQARYDPVGRTVECLGGARGTFAEGTIQAERLYWSLAEQTVQCPEAASGLMRGMPYTANGLTIDLKHRISHANRVQLRLRIESESGSKNRRGETAMKTTHRTKALAMSGLLMAAGSTMQATPRQTPGKTETKNAPAKPAPEKEKKEATIEFDNWEDADSAGTGAGTNFRYQEDDLVVTGDKARYKRNKKGKLERFEATGNLVMDDEKHHITGGKADVDHTKRLAIITENVVIVLKPKPEEEKKAEVKTAGAPDKKSDENGDASSERKRGVTITCDRVEDQYKKKFTTMRGHLVFKQKIQRNGKIVERTMTAEHAEYDGKTEQMELFKPVRAEDSDGQHIEFTDNVTLGTKEGEETLKSKGKVIIKTPVNEDEDEENGEATPKPADGKKATQ